MNMARGMIGKMFGGGGRVPPGQNPPSYYAPGGGQSMGMPPPPMPAQPAMMQRPAALPMAPGIVPKMMPAMPKSRQSAQLNPSVGQLLSNFGSQSSPKIPPMGMPGTGGY